MRGRAVKAAAVIGAGAAALYLLRSRGPVLDYAPPPIENTLGVGYGDLLSGADIQLPQVADWWAGSADGASGLGPVGDAMLAAGNSYVGILEGLGTTWAEIVLGKTVTIVPGDVTAPRGIRNHNPGNIRIGGLIPWQGQIAGNDPDFVTFAAPEWGLRALWRILSNYRAFYGANTIARIISRWAPPVENDTASYIAAVAAHAGVSPDANIDLASPVAVRVVEAIIKHENGQQPYSLAQIVQGREMAGA